PHVRQGPSVRPQLRGDHRCDRLDGACAGEARGRRRCRDARAGDVPARARLRRIAGLPPRETAARERARSVPRAQGRDARGNEGARGRGRMSFWARWFRGAPAPGFYVEGRSAAWNGWLAANPTVLPRRDWQLYVPAGASRWRRMPLIVLLHGCKQSTEEIVRGTRFEALADKLGAYVLLPKQSESANPYGCWNWFDTAPASGRGEAAIVASMMRKALRWRRTDDART